MISRYVPTLISGLVLVVASLMAGPALAETKAQKAFLERVKSVSTIDDASCPTTRSLSGLRQTSKPASITTPWASSFVRNTKCMDIW